MKKFNSIIISLIIFLILLIIILFSKFYYYSSLEIEIRTNSVNSIKAVYNESGKKNKPEQFLKHLITFSKKYKKLKIKLPNKEITNLKLYFSNKGKIFIKKIKLINEEGDSHTWKIDDILDDFDAFHIKSYYVKKNRVHMNFHGKKPYLENSDNFHSIFLELNNNINKKVRYIIYALILTFIIFAGLYFPKPHQFIIHFFNIIKSPKRTLRWIGSDNFFIFLFFVIYSVVQIILYLNILNLNMPFPHLSNYKNGLGFLNLFIIENLLICFLALWMIHKNKMSRIIFYLLLFLFLIINSLQFLSVHHSNNFITIDALGTIDQAKNLINFFSISILVLIPILLVLIFIIITEKFHTKNFKLKQRYFFTIIIALISFFFIHYRYSNPKRYQQIKQIENKLAMSYEAPLLSFGKLFIEVLFGVDITDNITLTQKDLRFANKFKININDKQFYPFIKEYFYKKPFPFEKIKEYQNPNIIIIFAESLSARKLESYGAKFKNLTPNINNFAQKSLVIDDYYNHVSPTLRGLKGQLCSIYPSFGYKEWMKFDFTLKPTLCLPHIFNKRGYDSIYMNYDNAKITHQGKQVKNWGFKKSFFKKDMLKLLNQKKAYAKSWGLSDHQMFRGLIKYLKKNKKKPFFLGFSTIETHAGMYIFSKDGVQYNHSKHNVLSTTHNFDHAFGEFWEYFKKSKYAKNTIVILTADHAHLPSKKFIQVAGDNYKKYLVDKIALMIYNPFYKLPKRFKAYTTSLDIAPSLLQMLNIKNSKNPFLGLSLFTDRPPISPKIAIYRSKFFIIDKNGLKAYSRKKINQYSKKVKTALNIIEFSRQMEQQNRLWKH